MTEHLDDSTQQFAPLFGANNAVSGTVADSVDAAASDSIQGDEMRKRRIWPWVVIACLLVALGGCLWRRCLVLPRSRAAWHNAMGKFSYRQNRAGDCRPNQRPGRQHRGTSEIPGQSATFTLKDLGIEVDGEAIASDVINAQRGDAWWQQYAFWITHDVAPQINPELADGSVVDKALNIDAQEPVDAQVALNDNNSGFNVIVGENGQGANATSIAKQAISTVESLGSVQPQTVRVELDVTEPTITNAIADEAKTTLETLVNNAVAIKVADKDIATVNASMLGSAMRIDANQQSKLKDNEVRNGYVVFDADKLQQYYDEQIKPNLKLEREDKKVVVNNAGEVLSTETEGHDGIVIADGADTEVGARLAQVLATGTGSVNVDGKVDPKQEVKVTHRVVIDLSDRKLYAYENDTVVKTLNVVVAEGNDNVTGECVGMMCTPTGDFNVWQKLPSQDMSGTLNLADGTVETWDVKDVGFVNYFSSGCAIHRIAGGYVADAVMPSIANGSHGCVGIGWDVAEWFYNWCNMGTSVHIQV